MNPYDYTQLILEQWVNENDQYTRRHSPGNLKSKNLVTTAIYYISLIKRGLNPTTKFVKDIGFKLLQKHPTLC